MRSVDGWNCSRVTRELMKEYRGRKDAEEVNLRAECASSKLKGLQDLI